MSKIPFIKLDDKASEPKKASDGAAAFDLYALEDVVLQPFRVEKVRTGIALEIPKGHKGEVYTRSGYAKRGIFVVNQPGKIDEDYRGEIFVMLMYVPQDIRQFVIDCVEIVRPRGYSDRFYNHTYNITAGDRIAQFEIQKVEPAHFSFVEELSDTDRGSGGLGSTGK